MERELLMIDLISFDEFFAAVSSKSTSTWMISTSSYMCKYIYEKQEESLMLHVRAKGSRYVVAPLCQIHELIASSWTVLQTEVV